MILFSFDPDLLPNPVGCTGDLRKPELTLAIGGGWKDCRMGVRIPGVHAQLCHNSLWYLSQVTPLSEPLFHLQGGRKVSDSEHLSSPIHPTHPSLSYLLFGFGVPDISHHAAWYSVAPQGLSTLEPSALCLIKEQREGPRVDFRASGSIGMKDPKNGSSPWDIKSWSWARDNQQRTITMIVRGFFFFPRCKQERCIGCLISTILDNWCNLVPFPF